MQPAMTWPELKTLLSAGDIFVEGKLSTPDARDPLVRSVWFIEHGEDVPRFVTAYPMRKD